MGCKPARAVKRRLGTDGYREVVATYAATMFFFLVEGLGRRSVGYTLWTIPAIEGCVVRGRGGRGRKRRRPFRIAMALAESRDYLPSTEPIVLIQIRTVALAVVGIDAGRDVDSMLVQR